MPGIMLGIRGTPTLPSNAHRPAGEAGMETDCGTLVGIFFPALIFGPPVVKLISLFYLLCMGKSRSFTLEIFCLQRMPTKK